jgi:hypothetical protein
MNQGYEVDFESDGWEEKALTILKSEGVLLVNNVFSREECDMAMDEV